jgi:hypothetical protein
MSLLRVGRRSAALAAMLVHTACGGAPSAPAARTPAVQEGAQHPPLHKGPLTDYVAAAGLRWLIVGEPQRWLQDAPFRDALSTLISAERLQRFADGSGIDLRTTPSALVAGFDYATIYMAATPGENAAAEDRFIERLIEGPIAASPHPRLRRVAGIIGTTPQTLVRLDRELVAVSIGDPTPARVVEAFARGKLRKSPSALRGSALSKLPPEVHAAPARFYAPGPFAEQWAGGARGLLARATAVAITAEPDGKGSLVARLYMMGDFDDDPEIATRLLGAWRDIAESSIGKLLSLNRPANEPAFGTDPDMLTVEVTLEMLPIARGLHAAVAADVWEMLDLPPQKSQR